jgi:hypothetical protein
MAEKNFGLLQRAEFLNTKLRVLRLTGTTSPNVHGLIWVEPLSTPQWAVDALCFSGHWIGGMMRCNSFDFISEWL